MNRAMLGFKRQLLSHSAHIKRVAHLDALEVRDGNDGEFTLVAKWRNGGEFSQYYSKSFVLGSTVASSTMRQAPRMRSCRFRDEFIRSILAARGV